MVSTASSSNPQWPLPLQIVAAAVLTPAESFLAAHVSQTVCDYMNFWTRQLMTSDALWIFGFGVILFAVVLWLKEKAGICLGVVVISSLLVALSVCLDVWHLRMP
jgi:ABC-type Na+ efflux pump permease subunit